MNAKKNYFNYKRNIGFRGNFEKEVINWLDYHGRRKNLCAQLTKAINFYYDYQKNTKGFLFRIIESNFELCKHLLRVIGRNRKIASEEHWPK